MMNISSFFSSGNASLISRSIGVFHFDIDKGESHEAPASITSNPTESGSPVSDHVILENQTITINGIMVQYDPPNYRRMVGSIIPDLVRSVASFDFGTITDQARSMADRLVGNAVSVTNPVTKFMSFENDSSMTLSRIGKAHNQLLEIRAKRETIIVQTGSKLYEDMILENVSLTQTKDTFAEFTLTLSQIQIKHTQKAGGLNFEEAPKSGRSETQSAAPQNKGETQTSALKDIFG